MIRQRCKRNDGSISRGVKEAISGMNHGEHETKYHLLVPPNFTGKENDECFNISKNTVNQSHVYSNTSMKQQMT